MKTFFVCWIITMLIQPSIVIAQPESRKPYGPQPQVGSRMPDFTLDYVTHYKKSKASLNDFKGKWLFLDFWFTGCVSCIKSFPKIDELQRAFQDQAQFVMVGINTHQYKDVVKTYETIRKNKDLRMVSAYDSVLYEKWGIWSMPHIIIIDPDGIVKAITTGYDLTADKMRDLINGKDVALIKKDREIPDYDVSTFTGSPDNSLVYRSILTNYNGERACGSDLESHVKQPDQYRNMGIVFVGFPLWMLYNQAYIGRNEWNISALPDGSLIYPFPSIEVKNDSLFQFDSTYREWHNLFNYTLAVHPSRSHDKGYIQRAMQRELANIFGYKVTMENRRMTGWKITAKPGAAEKLRSKGGEKLIDNSPVHVNMRNVPIETFLDIVAYHLMNRRNTFINVNETGFKGNIDVKMDIVLSDFDNARKALNGIGFDIVREERDMKVIVIKDTMPE